jgi:hypothetical protein
MGFDLSGMRNPPHKIVGSIRKLAGDVIALGNSIETWADETSRTRDAGNFVAGIAAILTNICLTRSGISTAGEHCGALDFSVTWAITGNRHNQGNGSEQDDRRSQSRPPSDNRPRSAMRVYCHLV